MKKRWLITIVAFICWAKLQAQQYDAQWLTGPNPSVIDFRNDTAVATFSTITGFFNCTITVANICDSAGNLLFMTNGIYIFDQAGNQLSTTVLSPCDYQSYYINDGLNIQQAALFIPKPGSNTEYYLFHESDDTLNSGRPGTLYYSTISTINNPLGEVSQINIPLCKGIFRDGGITACKHANGRDYWIIYGEHGSNKYYKFLLTNTGLTGPQYQSIGEVYGSPTDNMHSRFSQDGSKFAVGALGGLITIMDFDRCSGEFSNPVTIFNEASVDTIHHLSGSVMTEFSPNGRFLYVSDNINLNQYDLFASNIQDSVEIFRDDSSYTSHIDMIQLASNGKIYGSTWNGGFYFWHQINYPDSLGYGCQFVDTGIYTLSANSNNLPNMINYKLGPLVGSGCDTIQTGIAQTMADKLLRIQPNPADKYVYVEVGMQGNYEFDLMNTNGQVIDKKETRQVDIFDTEHLASGIYFVKVIDKGASNEIAVKKIEVVH